jgi:hypothetical protein
MMQSAKEKVGGVVSNAAGALTEAVVHQAEAAGAAAFNAIKEGA